jgi:hypothetical protein
MVFLGLSRAAGLKAYAMFVTDRDQDIFMKGQLEWNQLDDEIAIVTVGGKEMYFDPGERYCEFGKLHWKHSWSTGIRQTDKGTEISQTPFPVVLLLICDCGFQEVRVEFSKIAANV